MLIKRFKAKGFTKDISKLNKGVPNVFEAGQFKPFEAENNIGVKVLIKLLEAKAKEIARKISDRQQSAAKDNTAVSQSEQFEMTETKTRNTDIPISPQKVTSHQVLYIQVLCPDTSDQERGCQGKGRAQDASQD